MTTLLVQSLLFDLPIFRDALSNLLVRRASGLVMSRSLLAATFVFLAADPVLGLFLVFVLSAD